MIYSDACYYNGTKRKRHSQINLLDKKFQNLEDFIIKLNLVSERHFSKFIFFIDCNKIFLIVT